MKPENILYLTAEANNVKVVDFGSAGFIDDVNYSYLQTRPYRAPEIIFGCKFDFAVDIWSLGCVIYELITGRLLFRYKYVEENVAKALAINNSANCGLFANGNNYQNITKNKLLVTNTLRNSTADSEVITPNHNYSLSDELKSFGYETELIDFVQRCLKLDPNERMTPEEGLNHPFLKTENTK